MVYSPTEPEREALAEAERKDILHVFGVTAQDPPTYYYRTCTNLVASGLRHSLAAQWGAWQKVSASIPGRCVAPVVYQDRLYFFWVTINTRTVNALVGGNSNFAGYRHTFKLFFSSIRPDGTWTAPQEIALPSDNTMVDKALHGIQSGHFEDPVIDVTMPGAETDDGKLPDIYAPGFIPVPRYDNDWRWHKEAIDGYTLTDPGWFAIWPSDDVKTLKLCCRNFAEHIVVDLFSRRARAAAGSSPRWSGRIVVASETQDWATANKRVTAVRQAIVDAAGAASWNAWNAASTSARDLEGLVLAARSSEHEQMRFLYAGRSSNSEGFPSAHANYMLNACTFQNALLDVDRDQHSTRVAERDDLMTRPIAKIAGDSRLLAVPGSEEDVIIEDGTDTLLLQGSVTKGTGYALRRLGTRLAGRLARRLFTDGLDALLATTFQQSLIESGHHLQILDKIIEDRTKVGAFDGAYGIYYRELYFHIPFLIANSLSAQGNFAAAQRWYHYIFDPTSSERVDVNNLAEKDRGPAIRDRIWRFAKFRNRTAPSVVATLTDREAIERYKKDPFNPWAIARRRISATQKAIVMKYVTNLLDWGDSLFRQFTMESVNEALMLYVMASDILGPRPARAGECDSKVSAPRYADVVAQTGAEHDFMVEVETWTYGAQAEDNRQSRAQSDMQYAVAPSTLQDAASKVPLPSSFGSARTMRTQVIGSAAPFSSQGDGAMDGREQSLVGDDEPLAAESPSRAFEGMGWTDKKTAAWGPASTPASDGTGPQRQKPGRTMSDARADDFAASAASFGDSIFRQASIDQAFCIPANPQLLALWDRVEDRLYKIRNCMDLEGNLRELALFAPPINPADLLAMKAAGLSLEDVLGGGNGDLPPYRFLFLIERAKSYASTLSSFGSALLSALEKKDAEALSHLHLTHQANLEQAMLHSKQLEIDAANAALEASEDQLTSAQYRWQFYADRILASLNEWENAEEIAKVHALSMSVQAMIGHSTASGLKLAGQIGSLFAVTWGGTQAGGSAESAAKAAESSSSVWHGAAELAGMQAGFARRYEEWYHQRQLAQYDIQAATKQQRAAQIRVSIATKALDLQQKTLDQSRVYLERTRDKFTNLGLYTWLSGTLQALYRSAFQNALALANLAQHAFRFERGDYATPKESTTPWNAKYAGLLAGEQLLNDLHTLERRFIETNYRTLEIDQRFSLSQIDPVALTQLRETGRCAFTLNELWFDLLYPGHYKRRIKAVRLTVPCVAGPYVNVGATLELLSSQLRSNTDLADPQQPLPVPPTRTVTIATSSAQNDAGVFEMSFHDERYMPFEGLGAVNSRWQLTLPRTFRQFDYQTISDVVISVAYTAEQNAKLRADVEAGQDGLLQALSDRPMARLFSLRRDFPDAFTRLLRNPIGTPVTIEVTDRHLPMFAVGRRLRIKSAAVVLGIDAQAGSPVGFELQMDGTNLGTGTSPFVSDGNTSGATYSFGGLPHASLPGATTLVGAHTIALGTPGSYALAASGGTPQVDPDKLPDVLLYFEYSLVPS
ncbi:MAG: neuraminidase-like domain-containing protein [Myxococcales bacterium]